MDEISFAEYKMHEMNTLIIDCIEKEFNRDINVSYEDVHDECVGMNKQILLLNYN